MDEQSSEWRGDRPYTFRVTFISLAVGIVLSLVISLVLLAFRQPITANESGGVNWAFGAFMIPLAAILSMMILAWSIFSLPVRLAKRQGIVLDPHVWPITGAVAVGIIAVAGFFAAILFGLI
jgi:hypothetical protein